MVNTQRSQPRSQQLEGSGSSGGSGMTLWRAKALARTVEMSARASLRLLGSENVVCPCFLIGA